MQTSDHGFEQIMSAVLEQKQIWEKLQAENRELRQQLIDLRAGRGIFVEIMNQRFELVWDSATGAPELVQTAQEKRPQQVAKSVKGSAQPPAKAASGVLEEMLLDELSAAMNNRMGTSDQRKSSTSLNEEQKASLRRELSGSFLLE
ncbi:MAG TPA: hypothetical protein VFV38_32195 [Ktedonobacteraceae bacterium]|nr:hypothetical protein [Ktedonobacteraceae bacterium]